MLAALDTVPPANGATAIGDALALAGQMLPASGHRAIVLVTDGVNNNGVDPLEVAQQLGARGIAIYTVGIGTNGSGLAIPGTTEEASIDEDALREIATAGNGTYTRTVDAAAIAANVPRSRAHDRMGAAPRRRLVRPRRLRVPELSCLGCRRRARRGTISVSSRSRSSNSATGSRRAQTPISSSRMR